REKLGKNGQIIGCRPLPDFTFFWCEFRKKHRLRRCPLRQGLLKRVGFLERLLVPMCPPTGGIIGVLEKMSGHAEEFGGGRDNRSAGTLPGSP
ncbi:hypothetical protein N9F34_04630, partial [Alphaproteobacteria bacterium]|nr:hypothetical protein [Alphaproteobacteria bacterium]